MYNYQGERTRNPTNAGKKNPHKKRHPTGNLQK